MNYLLWRVGTRLKDFGERVNRSRGGIRWLRVAGARLMDWGRDWV